MTRETKAGLVVSCSFLCLVGAVVAVKLRQSPDAVALADAENVPPSTSKVKSESKATPTIPSSPSVNVPPAGMDITKESAVTVPPIPSSSEVTVPSVEPVEQNKHSKGKSEAHQKPSNASEPSVEAPPTPPPFGGVPVAAPSVSTGEKPSTPAGEALLPPGAGGVPSLEPPPHPATAPEGSTVPNKVKSPDKEDGTKEKHHKGPDENEKDKANTAAHTEQSPPPLPGAGAPPPGPGVSPPNLGEPAPIGEKTGLPSATPTIPPSMPEAGKHEHKESAAPPLPGAPAPISVAEPPTSSPQPPPTAGAPLPPIGNVPTADERPTLGSRPAPTDKPESPSPAPIGSAAPEPMHSDFIPKGPAPGAEPPAASGLQPIGDGNTGHVKLEAIRPMSAEMAPPGSDRAPNASPAPIGAPVPVMPASSQQPQTMLPAALPAAGTAAPLAPVGAATAATAPPIRLPESLPARPLAPSPAPPPVTTQVISYEEVRHTLASGETFESLSKEFYNTDSYAKALQMWNQNHPRASDAMARDGSIVAGDKIFIPPAAQLEQHYASVITNVKPAPRPSGAVQTSFTGAVPSATDFGYYKVVKDESVEVIARATLGTSDRANDLLRLNPNLRAGQSVTAGTRLLLPAGARVPPENADSK
jgi:LysM domain